MPFTEIILVFSIIVFMGYFIKSVTGFAGALFSVPLLALFFDVKFVVPIVSIIDMLAGLVLLPTVKKNVDKKELAFVLSGAIVGTAVGTFFLRSYANDVLRTLLGIVIGLFSVRMLLENLIRLPKLPTPAGSIFGALGGIAGGMFSTNGPPIILYLGNQIKNKSMLRGTLICIFLLDTIWRNFLFLVSGTFDSQMLKVAGCMVPILLITSFIGTKVHLKLNEDLYRRAIGAILLISARLLII